MTKLDVKYNSQRNNVNFKIRTFFPKRHYPSRTCFPTVLTMHLNYILNKNYSDETIITNFESKWFRDFFKSYYGKVKWMMSFFYKNTLRYLWKAEELLGNYYLNRIGKKLVYKSFKKFIDMISTIIESIDNGNPVIVGMKKRIDGRKFGHIILIVGYREDCFIVHDPYGNWNTNYKNHNGEGIEYSFEDMTWALHKDRSLFVE